MESRVVRIDVRVPGLMSDIKKLALIKLTN